MPLLSVLHRRAQEKAPEERIRRAERDQFPLNFFPYRKEDAVRRPLFLCRLVSWCKKRDSPAPSLLVFGDVLPAVPEAFEIVKEPAFLIEDMHDDVAVVEHTPTPFAEPLGALGVQAELLFEFFLHVAWCSCRSQ